MDLNHIAADPDSTYHPAADPDADLDSGRCQILAS